MISTDEDISDLSDKENVILDFYANWCAPCKIFSKMISSLVDDPKLNNVDLIKINVDTYQLLMQKFEVRSLPTIVFAKRNSEGGYDCIKKKIGSMDKAAFVEAAVKTYE